MKWILAMMLLTSVAFSEKPASEGMTVEKLFSILESVSEASEKNEMAMVFEVSGIEMTCITADHVNRMRIVVPIISTDKINAEMKNEMLEANYHSALDARYAISDGMVFGAFIHPLSTLTEKEVISAVYQVASLKLSFGSSYSSGILSFGEKKDKKQAI